jgi:hypothetical protein
MKTSEDTQTEFESAVEQASRTFDRCYIEPLADHDSLVNVTRDGEAYSGYTPDHIFAFLKGAKIISFPVFRDSPSSGFMVVELEDGTQKLICANDRLWWIQNYETLTFKS